MARTYLGVTIDRNPAGSEIRWSALVPGFGYVKADTLDGIKRLIRRHPVGGQHRTRTRSVTHPFDAHDYVTRRGHHLRVGDEVVVMTSNNVTAYGTVTHLLPRHIGDVADVRVRNPDTRRTLIVNAVNVEPDTGRVRGHARTRTPRVAVKREGEHLWTVRWESALYPNASRVAHFKTVAAARLFAQRVRGDVRHHAGQARTRATGAYHSHPAHPYSHPVATKHRRAR